MDTFKNYLPLCWFKSNPLELIRSYNFLKSNLIYSFIVEFFLQANMTDDPIESFYEVSLETLITLLFVALLLYLNKTMFNFIQISSALFFCSNAAATVIIPVLIWLTITENTISYYLVGMIIFWDFTMATYIFRRVLSLNIPASAIVALIYSIVTYFGAFTLGQLI